MIRQRRSFKTRSSSLQEVRTPRKIDHGKAQDISQSFEHWPAWCDVKFRLTVSLGCSALYVPIESEP